MEGSNRARGGMYESGEHPIANPEERIPAIRDFHPVYAEHIVFVLALARSMGLRVLQDREDLAHDVFLIAWRKRKEFDPAKGTARAWLAAITINEAKNWRRLARHRCDDSSEPDDRADPGHGAERLLGDAQVRAVARKLVDELPVELRLPLELIEFHRLTHKEAADALGLPQSTLSTRYYRACEEYQKKVDQLRRDKRLTVEDVRGVAILPTDVAGMFDSLRTSDLAVDPGRMVTHWKQLGAKYHAMMMLAEFLPPGSIDAASPGWPNGASSGSQDAGSPTSAAPTSPDSQPLDAAPPADAAPAANASSGVAAADGLRGGARLAGAVIALVGAAAGGAALHAALSGGSSPVPAPVGSDTSAVQVASAGSASAVLPTGSVPAASVGVTLGTTVTNAAAAYDSEPALFDRMRAAVSSRPSEALALAQKHARAYPGKNVQEREYIVIIALARTGRKAEAGARAAAFRSAYPASAYVKLIDAELGP